ncbi:MAG: VOC family protein [Planctomycetota bacterium]
MDSASHGDSDRDSHAAATRVAPQLMFIGDAQDAIDLYVAAFDDADVLSIERYGPDRPGGPDGTIFLAEIQVAGQVLRFTDSPIPHAFSFTPSLSLFVDCASREELERLAAVLGADGQVMMPLDDYGFSEAFTFIADRFGVSWQLNLPN